MTLRATVAIGLVCVLVGGIAGYCYQGKAADARFMKLETAFATHLKADSAATHLDSVRTDTVRVYLTVAKNDSLRVDSLTRLIGGKDSAMRAHLAGDSASTGTFTAFAEVVAARDSTERAEIASLGRVVAVQDTQIVVLRARVTEANVLLAQAVGVARTLAARADRRWHLVIFGGPGVTAAPSGQVKAGGTMGIGIGYALW
jgi:hypothetical protein